jgi:maltose-binding protein MalE
LYGLPWATENLGFFYNTNLVPIPPATWSELQTMGEALITSGDVVYGMSLAGKTYDAYPLMTAYGGYIFGQDLDGNWDPNDLGIDSPGMIAAVEWLAERVNDGFLSGDSDWESAHMLFETGQTPFLMTGPWSLDRIRASGIPYAIADFPSHTLPGIPFLGVQVFVINAHSANIPMAETFLLDFMATEDTMTALADAIKRPTPHIPAMANITDPNMLTFAAISEHAVPMPNIPEMGYVWGPWDNAVSSAMQGDQTAEEALTAAAQEILNTYLLAGMVNVPGTYQTQIGCAYDWQPSCSGSAMTEIEPGLWKSGPFELLAGNYEVKVALDGGWAINYGLDGIIDGQNIPFSLRRDGDVTFYWDEETKLLSIEKENFLFLPTLGK